MKISLPTFQSEPSQEYGSPQYDADAPPYGQSPIQSPYRVLPPISSAEARVSGLLASMYNRNHFERPPLICSP